MMFSRPGCLRAVVLLCSTLFSTAAIIQAAPQTPAQQPPAQQPAPPPAPQQPTPNRPNPFETVPQTPAKPPAEAPKEQAPTQNAPAAKPEAPRAAQPGQPPEDIVEAIEFRGNRRVRADTLQALIYSRRGDKYEEETVHRDFIALWNSGRFDDIRVEREAGKEGWILRYVVVERPVVRTIKYEGNKSVTVSEILDRYKERKVGLVVESQYDPNKVQRARIVLLEMLAEHGHQYAKVDPTTAPRAAIVARADVQSRRRSQGEGRRHRYRRQLRIQRPRHPAGHEEPAPHRNPAFHFV